jgi:hypothetical protein
VTRFSTGWKWQVCLQWVADDERVNIRIGGRERRGENILRTNADCGGGGGRLMVVNGCQ